MVKGNKLLAMSLAISLAAGSTLSSVAQADQMSEQIWDEQKPHGGAMILDTLIARPLLAVSAVAGTGMFIVSLPFSLLGGNTKHAFNTLVYTPTKQTFLRCLGCTPIQDERLAAESKTEEETPAPAPGANPG